MMDMRVESQVIIQALNGQNSANWDRFVATCPDATFFHRAGWKRVIEQSFGHGCHFIFAEEAGDITGVLPLVHVKTRLFGNSLISTGFTVGGGPAVTSNAALTALDQHAMKLADELEVDYVEYRSRDTIHEGWAQKPGVYVGFRRALNPDPEQNMLAIPRKQRAMVRKGIKAGLESRIDMDATALYKIYAISVRNLGTPVYPKRYFDNLIAEFGDDVDIVTVLNDGAPVASVMNFYFRNEVLPYYGGGTLAARPVAANDFMYWEVMRRACERGYQYFDFGRSKIGTGAFAFKKNWGFEPEPWTYEFKLRRLDELPDINPLNPKYRLFIAAWKKLPIPLANLIGPMLVRGLG